MHTVWKTLLLVALAFLAVWLGAPRDAQAVPAFARQTGMNCNSCHIGTDSVPNFTHTGRLFAMRGYTRPVVRERLRADGPLVGEPQYGGDYLALNWTDYFSARFISQIALGGHAVDGTERDWTTRPLARLAMFYTGPITDWLGLWTEIAYLGNNSLESVTPGNEGPSGLNLFAYDEFRLAASWDIGTRSFVGVSFGNEHPNVVGQFNFPVYLPNMWSVGQGGTGSFMEIGTISVHALLDRLWLQVAATSGGDNVNLSDGWNQYLNVSYNLINRQRNDLWLTGEIFRGNDFPSILRPKKQSFICNDPVAGCPAGITDANLSITNTPGGQPVVGAPAETVDDFFSYKVSIHQSVADRGPHSWVLGLTAHQMKQDFVSGAEVDRFDAGVTFRYFYRRTYGFEAYLRDSLWYEYKTAAGVERDVYSRPNYGIIALWYPAMNFSVHLSYTFAQNYVFSDNRAAYRGKGDNYALGFEYNF